MISIFSVESDATAICKDLDSALGYPVRGRHVGGGRHVDLDAPDRPGWTMRWTEPEKHPEREQWAVRLPDAEALPAEKLSLLEPAKATTVATLDATWAPKTAAPEKLGGKLP